MWAFLIIAIDYLNKKIVCYYIKSSARAQLVAFADDGGGFRNTLKTLTWQ